MRAKAGLFLSGLAVLTLALPTEAEEVQTACSEIKINQGDQVNIGVALPPNAKHTLGGTLKTRMVDTAPASDPYTDCPTQGACVAPHTDTSTVSSWDEADPADGWWLHGFSMKNAPGAHPKYVRYCQSYTLNPSVKSKAPALKATPKP